MFTFMLALHVREQMKNRCYQTFDSMHRFNMCMHIRCVLHVVVAVVAIELHFKSLIDFIEVVVFLQ